MENVIKFDPTSPTQLEQLMENELFRPELAYMISIFVKGIHNRIPTAISLVTTKGLVVTSPDLSYTLVGEVGFIPES